MRYFHNDYNRMCHWAVLQKLQSAINDPMIGYGQDEWCKKAQDRVRALCELDSANLYFISGGTQANMTVIRSCLRPHQGVLCAQSGHINVHETGAIEATGHKVIGLQSSDGRIYAHQIRSYMENYLSDADAEHTVQPKLVYISDSTEVGTTYTREQLKELSDICKEYGLYLFMDGARLGYALAAEGQDLNIKDIAALCDVFYIGLTKCGAMFGEAVVITNPALQTDFRSIIKQSGAMMAKGWLMGLQFEALFENGLYFDICRNANAQAEKIRKCIEQLGYEFSVSGNTNQLFPVLPESLLEKIKEYVTFSSMEKVGEDRRVVRFCTSWATTDEDVNFLIDLLYKFSK